MTNSTIKAKADKVITVKSDDDIPLSGIGLKIAKAELEANGFYSFTKNGENILLEN